ncbi:hypothetical protein G7Y89_g377 [Cudoniella acicularis]|uniref:Heterokaryon incompatibility domain-containing protein n=1 Tax=Cudoniella acicularis TaxID=354080 RepID=A0A8H4WAH0_9HELO|nr:hypothetical protein G7Y89_g377 [Cudoniella acicularis]
MYGVKPKANSLGSSLSHTIEDAIRVCWELNEQYLWVDSLCIIQDDPEDKKRQIGIMKEIYSSAVMTLVAAGEDAESGLPGVFHWPRDVKTFGLDLGVVELRKRMLSTHLLYFTTRRVTLTCNRGQMDEEGDLIQGLDASGTDFCGRIYRLDRHDVSLKDYLSIVNTYSWRRLRYRSDSLSVFSGVAKRIPASPYASNFIYGLPEKHFDQSLLWRHTGMPKASAEAPVFYNFETRSLIDWFVHDKSGCVRKVNVEKSLLGNENDAEEQESAPRYREDEVEFKDGQAKAYGKPGRLLFVAYSALFGLAFDETLHQQWYGAETADQRMSPYRYVSIHSDTGEFIGSVDMPRHWIEQNLPTGQRISTGEF